MRSTRVGAIFDQLRLDLRLRGARRRERPALALLGEAAASGTAPADFAVAQLVVEARKGRSRREELDSALTRTLADDRADFMTVSSWMRPVVVLRGICSRVLLRHQIALIRRALTSPHEAIGTALVKPPRDGAGLPRKLVYSVTDIRNEIQALLDERARRLAPFGGSALPTWVPHTSREGTVLGRAFWAHLRPTILPRASAAAGLAVGWWLGHTYTDSHLKSALHSLGLGGGGRQVVSGETYRTMMFWLPILAATLFAYLGERVHYLVQRRYSRPTPPA
jgi:hypothetical protein